MMMQRFGIIFFSKNELCQCLGLQRRLADEQLTEQAIASRLGTSDRKVISDFLTGQLAKVRTKLQRLMGTKDAAAYLSISTRHLGRLRAEDLSFPKPIKLQTDIRSKCLFDREDLDAWIDSKKSSAL